MRSPSATHPRRFPSEPPSPGERSASTSTPGSCAGLLRAFDDLLSAALASDVLLARRRSAGSGGAAGREVDDEERVDTTGRLSRACCMTTSAPLKRPVTPSQKPCMTSNGPSQLAVQSCRPGREEGTHQVARRAEVHEDDDLVALEEHELARRILRDLVDLGARSPDAALLREAVPPLELDLAEGKGGKRGDGLGGRGGWQRWWWCGRLRGHAAVRRRVAGQRLGARVRGRGGLGGGSRRAVLWRRSIAGARRGDGVWVCWRVSDRVQASRVLASLMRERRRRAPHEEAIEEGEEMGEARGRRASVGAVWACGGPDAGGAALLGAAV